MPTKELGHKNKVYDFLEKNEYILKPIMVSVSGFAVFGLPVAAIGLGFSILDQVLVSYNVTQHKYFTSVFIGCTVGYSVYPSFATTIVGGIISVTPTKYTFGLIGKYNFQYPLIATLSGASKGGAFGAAIGGSIGILDEFFINYNITDKHYLTYSTISVTTANALIGSSLTINALSVSVGVFLANYEEEVDLNIIPSDLVKDLYSSYSKVIKPEIIDDFITDYAESMLVNQIVVQKLMLKILRLQQDMIYQFEHIDDRHERGVLEFRNLAVGFTSYVLTISLIRYYFNVVQDYFSSKIYVEVDNNLKEILFANNTILRFSYNNSDLVLIDNLQKDSKIVSYQAPKIISSSTFKIFDITYALTFLAPNAPDILLLSLIYNQFNLFISKLLSASITLLDSQIKTQESTISTYLKHDVQNIRTIEERKGLEYSASQLSALYEKLDEYEFQKSQFSLVFDAYKGLTLLLDFIFHYYLIGSKIYKGELEFDERVRTLYSSKRFFKAFSMKSHHAIEIDEIHKALERIELFIEKASNINQIDEFSCLDLVSREYLLDSNELILHSFQITIRDKLLLNVDELSLVFGQVYGLTGPSGSGKSSLVSKISGISSNQVCAEGVIQYPYDTKIVTISQQDYFPLNATFQEIVFYPEFVDVSRTDDITHLLEKLGITEYELDQKENWYEVLSGGQKKKILIISALIQNPGILILDEAFNGLDKKSVKEIQDIIRQNLKQTLIISIDHNVDSNNKTGFYNYLLQVDNKRLILVNESIDDSFTKYERIKSSDIKQEVVCEVNSDYETIIDFLAGENVCQVN